MAVQAQYPSNAFSTRNGVLEEMHPLQHGENQTWNPLSGYYNYGGQPILNGAVFSDMESELTCNISGSRKRSRDDPVNLIQQKQQISNSFRYSNLLRFQEKSVNTALPNSLLRSHEENHRMTDSAVTSTSGRTTALISPLAVCLHQQNTEIETIIRLQNEKLSCGLDETRKRHCRSLLTILDRQVLKWLREKETELEAARRRNAELEEKVKQMNAENQIWFNVAKNSDAIVANLRSCLEQILVQNAPLEICGDSSDGIGAVADDAQSCCNAGDDTETEKTLLENREMERRRTCKVCREKEVSVLLLPCRHLCLCKACESKLDSCPICKSSKNASLQIFMS